MANTTPPEESSMTDTRTPDSVTAVWVEQARDGLDDLRDNPAPCGHESCTEHDRKLLAAGLNMAGLFVADIEQFEVDPLAAVKVLALLDSRLVDPALDMKDTRIDAWDLRAVLGAMAVAAHDVAQIRTEAWEIVKEENTSAS